MIAFGRDICNDLTSAEKREWLVTNGIGGFASGTIAGTITRRYHGLLLAALRPPSDRTLLVTKLDEIVQYNQQSFKLFTNNWVGQPGDDKGHLNIEQFYLEGTTPVWQFALAEALLEKRIWMQKGANTTYIQYKLLRAFEPLSMSVKAFFNYRHYHNETQGGNWDMQIEPVANGLKVTAYEGAIPYYLLSDKAAATAVHEWYYRYFLIREANRGLQAMEDNLFGGRFDVTIAPGETVTFVASIDATPNLNGAVVYHQHWEAEQALLENAMANLDDHPAIRQLVLSANQFVVKRPFKNSPGGRSIIAGYHWFSDWGRDTMISLPGLTLVTKREEIAAEILRTFAFYVSGGMLPNRFPDIDAEPEYNTVDAALWYFEAMRAYHAATGNDDFVRRLFSVLADIIAQHKQGTRYNIHVDPEDGLLFAGEKGQQLTWMDAKIGDRVITPRIGKPVEINAFWYNALRTMESFAVIAEENGKIYKEMADKVKVSFGRFWNEGKGYCFDVIDTPEGDDSRLRPNQLFAVSLPHSPLTAEQQKMVVDVCARHLLTSHGMRSLAPFEQGYIGSYGGNIQQRDSAYHQGTVWAWLLGPFIEAHLRVYGDLKLAREFLRPMLHHITSHGLGSIGEIFDGDPPFSPRGTISQAWSVAETLRIWKLTEPKPDEFDVPYLTTNQMIEVDRAMMEDYHIELIQMMENAGRNLAHLARERFLESDPRGKKVIVLAGTGGNGGGAMVCARRLHNYGAQVAVYVTKKDSELAPVPSHQLDILRRMKIPVETGEKAVSSLQTADKPDLIIDGIIGYSLKGAPRGTAADLIRWTKGQTAPVLSLDVPSGVDTTTGKVYSTAVQATATLTLALPKAGMQQKSAAKQVGELYLADISVPPELYQGDGLNLSVEPLFAMKDIVRIY